MRMEPVILHSEEGFAGMRVAGRLAADVLDMIGQHVIQGVTTETLDQICHDYIVANNAVPAPLNYKGFPKATCISLNHVVCHGIPGAKKLRDGDILNIDVTVIVEGWYGDTSRMFYVGEPSVKARRLTEITYECLMHGIEAARPGATLGDVGHAIQTHAEMNRFSVVRDFTGHGLGQTFHCAPTVLHYGTAGEGQMLQPGMIFTIEPMINAGRHETKILSDGWTAVTRDKSLSAQFEHSIGITEDAPEIFTLSKAGYTLPPYL
ncbi:type I methionyl aminopeptidase [SAR116 cluster bacterium]|nr:type I methionyl aminopeptidase [SAR116 cluster bacterium]